MAGVRYLSTVLTLSHKSSTLKKTFPQSRSLTVLCWGLRESDTGRLQRYVTNNALCWGLRECGIRKSRQYVTHNVCRHCSASTDHKLTSDAVSSMSKEDSALISKPLNNANKQFPGKMKLHSRLKPESNNLDWLKQSQTFSPEDSFGDWTEHESDEKRNSKKKSKRFLRVNTSTDIEVSSEGTNDEKWAGTFGTLDPRHADLKEIDMERQSYEDDEGEDPEEPYRRLAVEGRKHTQNWYGKQIERLSKEGKIYECIDVLEKTMLKEDRVQPNQYVFTVLIGALGRVGYTKKAFSLFNKMKKFGLEPEDPTYTALFNACSNSPWREDGLKRARHLRELIAEKGYQPNLTTYRAMVKAFGLCGDLQMAFALVDELTAAGYRADERVLSMLLHACVSDKEAGLRHAIQVWRLLSKKKKLRVNRFHYNLLLRAVRDCQIGDPILANQLLQSQAHDKSHDNKSHGTKALPINNHSLLESGSHNPMMIDAESQENIVSINKMDNHILHAERHCTELSEVRNEQEPLTLNASTPGNVRKHSKSVMSVNSKINSVENSKELTSLQSWWVDKPDETKAVATHIQNPTTSLSVLDSEVPNILSSQGDFSNVMGLGDMSSPENRLALFGGLPGVLERMAADRVAPDVKTFTLLLDVLPSSRDAERDLMAAMTAHRVPPDIDIINLMIRKRNLRKDYEGAKSLLSLLGPAGLQPNLMTYGCLAMGCPRKQDGMQLLRDMENASIVPSVNVYTILLTQSRYNFSYKLAVCQNMQQQEVRPNKHFLSRLETSIDKARTLVVRKEKGLDVPSYAHKDDFIENFNQFMKYYRKWLFTIGLDRDPHPWEQFRHPTPND